MAVHYLRYFIVLLLLGSLFYTHTIEIKQSTIKDALDKKMPLVIDKKGFITTIHSIDMLSVVNNVVESTVKASLKVSRANTFAKLLPKKSIHFTILSKAIPKVHGKYLSFSVLSLKINKLIQFKKVKGLLKSKLEAIKIRIKALEKLSWLASVNSITLQDNGMVVMKLNVSKWILLVLIPLFLLREIGLLLSRKIF